MVCVAIHSFTVFCNDRGDNRQNIVAGYQDELWYQILNFCSATHSHNYTRMLGGEPSAVNLQCNYTGRRCRGRHARFFTIALQAMHPPLRLNLLLGLLKSLTQIALVHGCLLQFLTLPWLALPVTCERCVHVSTSSRATGNSWQPWHAVVADLLRFTKFY